jgi:hypothetical protein
MAPGSAASGRARLPSGVGVLIIPYRRPQDPGARTAEITSQPVEWVAEKGSL